ncbi:MAG: transposase [Nanoarchaeota archaeon]
MIQQTPLLERKIIVPIIKDEALELEKYNYSSTLANFFDKFSDEQIRPHYKNALKCLLLMAYPSNSYRKGYSEMLFAQRQGIISHPIKRSAVCKYMNSIETYKLLGLLIQESARQFIRSNQTLILDSTWMGLKMYVGGFTNKPASKRHSGIPSLRKTRKLHIGIIRDSKVIAYARTSQGTEHDAKFFEEIVTAVKFNGFDLNTVLADAGYLSKRHYELTEELGIQNAFINFRSNSKFGGGSKAWNTAFNLYKKNHERFRDAYRYRWGVEGVISTIKRRSMNWLRTRNDVARDNELMLKALIHNLVIIGKS